MADLIPRFAINYGLGAFSKACFAALRGSVQSEAGLKTIFGKRELIWTGSGRQTLILILRALNLKPEAKIAVPLFSSGAVATSLASAGFQPVFVDIDPVTLTMHPRALERIADRVSAVVPVHLFGNLAAMDRIMDAAGSRPVIEDAAQAPLGYWGKQLVGTIGTASFYSFASSKALAGGGGGMAATSDSELASNLRSLASELHTPARVAALKSSAQQLAKAALFSRTLYGPIGNRMRASTEERGFLLAEIDSNHIAGSSAAAVSYLAGRFGERMKRQRENSLKLIYQLGDIEGVTLPREPKDVRYSYTLFPVLVANQRERDAVRAGLLERGVDTSIVHHNSVETAVRLGYQGGCPVAEDVCQRIFTLPNYAGLNDGDLDRIAVSFREAILRHRSGAKVLHMVAQVS